MTCPRCKCPACANTERPRSPLANLPGWDIAERVVAERHNAETLQAIRAKDEWRDTFPDAAELAMEVGNLAGELERGAA